MDELNRFWIIRKLYATATAAKAQQAPHLDWSFTEVTAPFYLQSSFTGLPTLMLRSLTGEDLETFYF
jgi:hypothetical protein